MVADILYVDDDDGAGRIWLEEDNFNYISKTPGEVSSDEDISAALQGIKIVLMDYNLHEQGQESSLTPPIDGIELLERFRAVIRRHGQEGLTRPLLVIYTGKTDKLIEEFKCPSSAPYFLAPRAKVDWVFPKGLGQEANGNSRRLNIMLSGFNTEFEECDTDPEQRLYDLLKLPTNKPWTELAKEQVNNVRPPISSMLEDNHRVELMKWLLQISLPLPTFPGCFINLNWVAARLGMNSEELICAVEKYSESELSQVLEGCKYKGVLANFYGDLYWKAGVDHFIWKYTQGLRSSNQDLKDKLISIIGTEVAFLDQRRQVFLVSPLTYEPTEETCDMDEAVQIKPEFWPDGIELPWVKIDQCRNDQALKSIVINEDRDRLQEAENF